MSPFPAPARTRGEDEKLTHRPVLNILMILLNI